MLQYLTKLKRNIQEYFNICIVFIWVIWGRGEIRLFYQS